MKKIHLLLFCLVTIMQAEASHLVGGDIEYKSIGFRRWEIKLVLYRECNGIPMPGCTGVGVTGCTKTLTVKPMAKISGGGLNPNGCSTPAPSIAVTVTSYLVQDSRKIRQDVCGQSAKNSCDNRGTATPGSFNPSLEAYYYKGILDMSSPAYNNACPYWEVAWEECCRGGETENILNAGGINFFISGVINIFYNRNTTNAAYKNNSPQLFNEPIDVVCSSQEVIYNMGAVDPDRDSLTYAIGTSRGIGGANVVYKTPFSAIYPFPLDSNAPPHSSFPQPNGPYVIIDSLTGDIAFNGLNNNPTLITYGCINVEITQWAYDANGSPYIVGRTQRELQVFVRSCPSNNSPAFTTSPALLNGNPKYNWSVCAGDQICFTITAKDNDDGPGPQPSTKLDTTYLSWNNSIVRPGKLTFLPDYNPNTQPRPVREDRWRFCWQTEKSDGSTQPYSFTAMAVDNSCPNIGISIKTFNITVQPPPIVKITAAKDTVCSTDASLQLNGTPANGVFSGSAVSNNGLFNIQNPTVLPNNSYSFTYRFTNVFGCTDSALKTIFVLGTPAPLTITGNANPIKNTTVNYSVSLIPNQSYVWSANKGVVQNSSLNMASVLWTDTGAAWVKVVTSNACGTATSEQNIQVAPTVGLNKANGLSNVTLYPNPTFGEVFITGNTSEQQVLVEVFNNTLQLVYSQSVEAMQGKISTHFTTENLSNGLYFVKIGNGSKYGVYKILVMK